MAKKFKGENSLSHYDMEPGSFTSLQPLLKEARLSNMWLYNKYSHTWFTPDEFEERCKHVDYTNHDIDRMINNVVIRNPIAGIKAYHKELNEILEAMHKETVELRAKAEEFNKKVIDYYQNKC